MPHQTNKDERIVIDLPQPVEATHECLPHAAMSLGAPANVPRLVSRLVIEKTGAMWTLFRLDADGGFVGDTTHGSLEDAWYQAGREFGVTPPTQKPTTKNAKATKGTKKRKK